MGFFSDDSNETKADDPHSIADLFREAQKQGVPDSVLTDAGIDKPDDKYDTKLSPEEEQAFHQWAVENGRTGDTKDYDMRGWWRENGGAAPGAGHFTDKFKKPNHPTFSDESIYHGVDGNNGGHWGEDNTFTPSDTILKHHTPEELRAYFKRVEPDIKLLLPGGN